MSRERRVVAISCAQSSRTEDERKGSPQKCESSESSCNGGAVYSRCKSGRAYTRTAECRVVCGHDR